MTLILAAVVGIVFAAGFYSLMRRGIGGLAIAIILMGHAANLILFASNGLIRDNAPIVTEGEKLPPFPFPDPLPQALILTAIVINFGMFGYLVMLLHRTGAAANTQDMDALRSTEEEDG